MQQSLQNAENKRFLKRVKQKAPLKEALRKEVASVFFLFYLDLGYKNRANEIRLALKVES